MGAGVSGWRLARAVSRLGQLGVVSGTALDLILSRRLQRGDPQGDHRRALKHFPDQAMAARVEAEYFVPGGKKPDAPYKPIPMHAVQAPRKLVELCVVANFVEVFLAREGHAGVVGINLLEKVQLPHLPSLYGAMLAGVHYVLMGAGIPHRIPGVLDLLARHEPASYKLAVSDARSGEEFHAAFNPKEFMGVSLPPLHRPYFLPIIASNTLATMLTRKSNGRVDGFVIEGPTAGGHNAPPRGKKPLSSEGEPVYDERDEVDLDEIRALGLPFWVAGGAASPEKYRAVLAAGGQGIQVGTAFAYCEESDLEPEYKMRLLAMSRRGEAKIFTDPRASPTGFPFKVARLEGTMSEEPVYLQRTRVCDLGYLRELYRRPDGLVGYRCASEPIDTFLKKGGDREETKGRKCLCNALMANIGHPQQRKDGREELPLITSGDDVAHVARFLPPGKTSYGAREVIEHLMGAPAVPVKLLDTTAAI